MDQNNYRNMWYVMSCSITGLPRLGDKIIYDIKLLGGALARLVFELPENFTSLLEWLDYIVPEVFEEYVSRAEKIVLDDFFGFRGRAYGLITLFSVDNGFEDFLEGGIRIFTSESQPLNYVFERSDSCFIDFIYSYSVFYPSNFRPEYRHPDFKFYNDSYIGYYNYLGNIKQYNKLPRNGIDDFEIYIYPPNILGGRIDIKYFYPEFNEAFEVLDRGDKYVRWYFDVLNKFSGDGVHIFPLMFNEGLSFKGGFIVADGHVKYYDDLKMDLGGLVIDLSWEMDSNRPSLSFKRFRSVVPFKGKKYLANIGFSEYPPPPSHRIIEYRLGSKLIWSSPSIEGLIPIKMV